MQFVTWTREDLDDMPSADADPVEAFLAQPPSVEAPGVDAAARKRPEILHSGPDADSIAEAFSLLRERHPFE